MAKSTETIFISGANRGIGFELVQHFSQEGYTVIAGYRQKEQSQRLLAKAEEFATLQPFNVEITAVDDLKGLHDFIANQYGRAAGAEFILKRPHWLFP